MYAIFEEQFLKFLNAASKEQLDHFIQREMVPLRYHTATVSLTKWAVEKNKTFVVHDNFRYVPIRLFDNEGALMVLNASGLIGFYALKTESRAKVRWRLLHALYHLRETEDIDIMLPAMAQERAVTIGFSTHYVAANENELWTILTELGNRVGDHVEPKEFPVLISVRPKSTEVVATLFPYILTPWRTLDKIAYDLRHAEEISISQK